MSISPYDSQIFGPLYGAEEVKAELSDQRLLQNMMLVEAALARVQARLKIIPSKAAEQITKRITNFDIDWAALAAATQIDGFPVSGLVSQLRSGLEEPGASYLHWGATTQDILDTARILQFRKGLELVEARIASLIALLADLAEEHRDTLMAGRTHSQQALPITFGFKVAGWLAPLLRTRDRLGELRPRLLVVQFGGGVGTLSVLGGQGPKVASALAKELALGEALLPWHAQRDSLVELGGWLAMLIGQLANIAQDIVLLAQSEVGEVRESRAGGSSTMPHKHNPIQSEWIIGAARHAAALQHSLQSSLVQEHERGASAWPVEMLALPQLFSLAGSASAKALNVLTGLEVDAERMQANLAAEHWLVLAEALSIALSAHMPRAQAADLVRKASLEARQQARPLPELIRERVEFNLDWKKLEDPQQQIGAAAHFIDRVLAAARR